MIFQILKFLPSFKDFHLLWFYKLKEATYGLVSVFNFYSRYPENIFELTELSWILTKKILHELSRYILWTRISTGITKRKCSGHSKNRIKKYCSILFLNNSNFETKNKNSLCNGTWIFRKFNEVIPDSLLAYYKVKIR